MSQNFVRYNPPATPIKSEQGNFVAWSTRKRTPPGPGDVIWVVRGIKGPGSAMRYVLQYYFEVAKGPTQVAEKRFEWSGQNGHFCTEAPLLSDTDWFLPYFNGKMGKGGLAFSSVPDDVLPHLLALRPKATSQREVLDNSGSNADVEEMAQRAIKTRKGQPAFRAKLLKAYDRRCCITGCTVEQILEAAHILAHADETDYSVNNGLLLRADIHTLFDLHLLQVDDAFRISVSPDLIASEYQQYHGRRITLPNKLDFNPRGLSLKSARKSREAG